MQTAVTTFQRNETGSVQQVELHAQLHFGQESYFESYNSRSFNERHDAILFELLLDETLLETERISSHVRRHVVPGSTVGASLSDMATASEYGWSCQVDCIDYTQPKWIHADLTRQEFVHRLDTAHPVQAQTNQPLWQAATKSSPFPAAATEAATALFTGPPVLTDGGSRRLFTNPYLPGSSLASTLRGLLWLTVPAPEVSVLLLDWASLLMDSGARVSKVSLWILQSLLTGQLDKVRQLVFGQVVLASNQSALNSSVKSSDWSLLVTERNDHAVQVLDETLQDLQGNNNSDGNVALLYGCSHCPDLHSKLIQRGFTPISTEYRTAWSVPFASTTTLGVPAPYFNGRDVSPIQLASALVVIPIYLAIGGLDWIGTLLDVVRDAQTDSATAAAAGAMLYLLRHVLLYVGLSKFVLDFGGDLQNEGD